MAKSDDWWQCLKHLFGGPSPAMSSLGAYLANFDPGDGYDLNPGLLRFGLAIYDMPIGDAGDIEGGLRHLVVPAMSEPADQLFKGTRWANGRYWDALKSAPGSIVLRERGGARYPIGNVQMMCVFVDLAAWGKWCEAHVPEMATNTESRKLLASYIDRMERLAEEKAAITTDMADVMKEAASSGFDAKAIRECLRLRKMDPDDRRNLQGNVAVYMDALDGDGDG